MYGAIEAGGTKFVVVVSDENLKIIDRQVIETQEPIKTMKAVNAFFHQYPIKAIGIGCFGPVDINPSSTKYGTILNTPKIEWQQFNFIQHLEKNTIPIYFQTDVNVAAYGELLSQQNQSMNSLLYLTIGTGIGGGFATKDGFVYTRTHQEMGHISIKRLKEDSFIGNCPFHHDCLEGLVSGPAIEKRVGKKADRIESNDIIWETIAHYIARALVNYELILSPDQIILGGGVMHQKQLFPLIRKYFKEELNHYIDDDQINFHIDSFIKEPLLGDNSAIVGCLLLAKKLHQSS